MEQLTREFRERHPAKAAASRFVDALFVDARPPPESLRDRERDRVANELHVRFYALYDLFAGEPSKLEEFIFDNLLKIMLACHALGMHAAPDGRAGRSASSRRAGVKRVAILHALMIYLEHHPKLEPKASEKFANIIRPDILDALGLPKDAARPSLSALVKALRSIRTQSFVS